MLKKIMFLLPMLGVLFALAQMLVKKLNKNKIITADGRRIYLFKPETRVGRLRDNFTLWYKTNLSDYTPKYSFTGIMKAKFLFMGLAIILMIGVQLTNIQIYTKDIMNVFEYRTDVMGSRVHIKDIASELESEVKLMKMAITDYNIRKFKAAEKDYVVGDLRFYIADSDLTFEQSEDMVIDKVYNRLQDYFESSKFSYFSLVLFGLVAFMLPDLYLMMNRLFVKGSRKRELRFLKRLIILNGSIKPVDFNALLKGLMERSTYHRSILTEIYNANQNNRIDTKTIYRKYINAENELDVKLFYEKLDQANNSNFDQAIRNIKDDFNVERRQRQRIIRKRIELIHTISVAGIICIIALMIIYLLMPWMQAYNLNEMIKY